MRAGLLLTYLLLLVLAASVPMVFAEKAGSREETPPTAPTSAVFTAYVENFDPRTGLVTVAISGPAGSYRVEVVSGGRLVFSRTVYVPGTVAVRLEKQEIGNVVQMSGVLRIVDPQSLRVLYSFSIFISFYAPKPQVYVERAVLRGASVDLTIDVVTSVRTDLTVYVDEKPVISRTIDRPTKINVTVRGGGMHTVDISMVTDFGSYTKSFTLIVPTTAATPSGAVSSARKPRILGVVTTKNSVIVNYETPASGTVELYIDGQLAASRSVEAGRGTVTFMVGDLSGRHTLLIKLSAAGQMVSTTRIIGSEQTAPKLSPEAIGAIIAVVAILGILALTRRGGISRP